MHDKLKIIILQEEADKFEEVITKLFNEGYSMETDTYRVFEFGGKIIFSAMLSKGWDE